MRPYAELEAEALAAPVSGWDFTWLSGRSDVEPLPWSYRAEVARYRGSAATMLDMGTGGGEVLSGLGPLPARTVAIEAWPPNVPVATARLRPLGIPVVHYEAGRNHSLPFKDGSFDLVLNRHEEFTAAEVSRILAPGGVFITQQVDRRTYDDLYRLLDMPVPDGPDSWLPVALRHVSDSGLTVLASTTGIEREHFHDVAGIIYYLRLVSWALPDYSLEAYRDRFRAAWADRGRWPALLRQHRFLLVAEKPPG